MFQPTFVEYRERKILRLDYTSMTLSAAVVAMQQSMQVIASEAPNSVLAITLWDAPLSRGAVELIRRHVVLNTPFIRASAVVTPRPIQRVVFDSMTVGGRKRLKVFDQAQPAIDWLLEQ